MTELYEAIVRRYARKFCKGGIEYDDLLQVGRLAAFQAKASWRPDSGSSLATWTGEAVKSSFLNYTRTERRNGLRCSPGRGTKGVRPRLESIDAPILGDTTLHDRLAKNEDPTEEYAGKEILELLKTELERLSHVERVSVLDERPMREVAPELGISKSRVDQVRQQTVQKLRHQLTKDSAMLQNWKTQAELIMVGRDLTDRCWKNILLDPKTTTEWEAFRDFVFYLNHTGVPTEKIAKVLDCPAIEVVQALNRRRTK